MRKSTDFPNYSTGFGGALSADSRSHGHYIRVLEKNFFPQNESAKKILRLRPIFSDILERNNDYSDTLDFIRG